MKKFSSKGLDWAKGGGLLPAVVQDAKSGRVLMLGYMNEDSLKRTLKTGRVTFFSRSRGKLWVKGETSGNGLRLRSVTRDCDSDALLVLAEPKGPTCHTGAVSCFDAGETDFGFLALLEDIIEGRRRDKPKGSYTASLFAAGVDRIAQKVGEEGVETALAARGPKKKLHAEAADLLFHLAVLLRAKGSSLRDVAQELARRNKPFIKKGK
jgi:phosphoribosyl-ATP pyrophosphohydrolase/phosphoribosyl-AMP cyclohydrolase